MKFLISLSRGLSARALRKLYHFAALFRRRILGAAPEIMRYIKLDHASHESSAPSPL
jgi:hypothetical protein